jgi:hypothetical protein
MNCHPRELIPIATSDRYFAVTYDGELQHLQQMSTLPWSKQDLTCQFMDPSMHTEYEERHSTRALRLVIRTVRRPSEQLENRHGD